MAECRGLAPLARRHALVSTEARLACPVDIPSWSAWGDLHSQGYSILSRIGLLFPVNHTPVFQTEVEGAIPSCPTIFRDANTGASQDFTDLTAAVQLRLRVATGSQALQRCSGLLNRRARSVTVATHHFAGVAQQRQVFAHGGSFVNCRAFAPRECRWPRTNALSVGSISLP